MLIVLPSCTIDKPVSTIAYVKLNLTGPQGNCGCEGGLVDQAFEYIIKNKGIACGLLYPYWARVSDWTSLWSDLSYSLPFHAIHGQDGLCHYWWILRAASMSDYRYLASGNETELQVAVATVGPISVAIDASKPSFQVT